MIFINMYVFCLSDDWIFEVKELFIMSKIIYVGYVNLESMMNNFIIGLISW